MPFPTVTRGPITTERLLWVTAKNRSTGAEETMGLWTGQDHRTFNVGGVNRDYFGAGTMLSIDGLVSRAGLNVQMQTITLNVLTPEVEQLLRGYDTRQAPVELHLALFNPETDALQSLTRVFRGWMDELTISAGARGKDAVATAMLAASSRELTRTVQVFKSDESWRARSGDDRFFRHADRSGSVPVFWGMKRRGTVEENGAGRPGPVVRSTPAAGGGG